MAGSGPGANSRVLSARPHSSIRPGGWGFSFSHSATPLGLGFGFRVQTGLHSSAFLWRACSCLSPKLAKLITVTQDLQFLRASRGAQADKAGAGCYAGPYGGIPFPASQCRLQAGSPGSAPTSTTIFLLSASPLTLQDYVCSDCLGSLIC